VRTDGSSPPEPLGKFLVVVGIDGSGKSTLLRALDVPGTAVASWQDLRSHEAPATLAPESPTAIRNRVPPLARAMFIGGHLVAQYEYLVRPRIEAGINVVLDSYHFKLLAKEKLFGLGDESLERLCAELPLPDAVVFIDVDPRAAFERKEGVLSPYEYQGEATLENFVAFQSTLRDLVLSQLASVPYVVVDGSADSANVLRAVRTEIERRISPSRQLQDLA
jgi:thymidylate kinase